jgi:hypothetical protein
MIRRVFRALDSLYYWVSKGSLLEVIEQDEGRKFFPPDTVVFNKVLEEFDFCGYAEKIVLRGTELFQITEAGKDKWYLLQGKTPEARPVQKGAIPSVGWKALRIPHGLDSIPDPRNLSGVRGDVELSRVPCRR